MEVSEYQSMLDYEAKKQYKEKLTMKSKRIPDPYAMPQVDDVTKWPTVLYGDVYYGTWMRTKILLNRLNYGMPYATH